MVPSIHGTGAGGSGEVTLTLAANATGKAGKYGPSSAIIMGRLPSSRSTRQLEGTDQIRNNVLQINSR